MTQAQIMMLALLSAAIMLFISQIVRADLVALLLLMALGAAQLLTPQEVLSGFGRSAVMIIMSIFILTHALDRTGVTHRLGASLLRLARGSEARLVMMVMLAGGILSLFMNTIAAGAVLLPVVMGVTKQSKLNPSKLLMPLSFSTLLGGMATLFTTSNLLVATILREQGLPGLGLLNFAPVGGAVALAGIAFMALIGRRLLPDRQPLEQVSRVRVLRQELSELYQLQERLWELRLEPQSALVGKSLAQSGIGASLGLNVLAIVRGGRVSLAPKPGYSLLAEDILLIEGREERVAQLAARGLHLLVDLPWQGTLSSDKVGMVEVLIPPRSRAVGLTLKQLCFREKYTLSVVALWREGHPRRTDVGDVPLRFGDALLVYGEFEKARILQADPDYLVLLEDHQARRSNKAALAVGIMIATMLVAAAGWLPIAETMLGGALLAVLTGCLTMDEAYEAIEWRVVFLIAAMLPVGLAMTKSGTAAWLGQVLMQALGRYGPYALLAGFYLLTVCLTQAMSSQATAAVLAPVALAAAQAVGANPYTFALAVAMGCSTAFLTPLSHPVNILMMGPGGYTFRDYARVGLPLTVVSFAVTMIALPVLWPLHT